LARRCEARWPTASRGEVDSFGERMFQGGSTLIEKVIGMEIARDANSELAELYRNAGMTVQAENVGPRLEQLEQRARELKYHRHARDREFRE
jgi:hypothetical protein